MKKFPIRMILGRALTIYTFLAFANLPIFYMYPDKAPIVNYSVIRSAMIALNNKNVLFLLLSFALIALFFITTQRIMYRDFIIPIICSLVFVADIVQIFMRNNRGTTVYIALAFDLIFLVLFALYFTKYIYIRTKAKTAKR